MFIAYNRKNITMDPEAWVQQSPDELDFDRETYPDPFFLGF